MNRLFFPTVLVLTALTGCDTAPGQLGGSDVDTLFAETRGVVLIDDNHGAAGMYDVHCEIFANSGSVGADYYEVPGEDVVVAALGTKVATIGNDGLYVDDKVDWQEPSGAVITGTDIVDGGLYDGGAVAVSFADGLTVDWAGDLSFSTRVPASAVPTSTSVDAASGTIFVAESGDVMSVDPGATTVLGQGDLVVFDGFTAALYTADLDGMEIRGLEIDGAPRFTTPIDGTVAAITKLGSKGQAVAMTELDGRGMLVFVDGTTGDIVDTHELPGVAQSITSSPSGDTLALTFAGRVHFLHL